MIIHNIIELDTVKSMSNNQFQLPIEEKVNSSNA